MSQFERVIKEAKPDLKRVSVDRYVGNLTKLCLDLDLEPDIFSLTEYDVIMNYLNNKADSTKKAYLNSIIVVLRDQLPEDESLEKYINERDNLNKEYFDNSNNKNDKENENMITLDEWDLIIKGLDEKIKEHGILKKTVLNKSEYNIMLQHLLLSLYRQYALRNDYALMRVRTPSQYKVDNDDLYNYLIINPNNTRDSYFILNNYKTNKTYGSKKIIVDKKTLKLIRRFLKFSPNPSMLIVDHSGNPFTRNRLSKFLISTFKTLVNKSIGTQILRKSYLSGKYSDIMDEMKEDAEIMGHSINTQQTVYIKTK
jgi:hypothetical protein